MMLRILVTAIEETVGVAQVSQCGGAIADEA